MSNALGARQRNLFHIDIAGAADCQQVAVWSQRTNGEGVFAAAGWDMKAGLLAVPLFPMRFSAQTADVQCGTEDKSASVTPYDTTNGVVQSRKQSRH